MVVAKLSAMSVLKGLVEKAKALLAEPRPISRSPARAQAHGDVRSHEERLYAEQYSAETEIERLDRKCREYFRVIESIERERDEWRESFHRQTREHFVAQALLERKILETRQISMRLLHLLNEERKTAGKEVMTVTRPSELVPYDGEPVGMAEKYLENMKRLWAEFPELTNGRAERERIHTEN